MIDKPTRILNLTQGMANEVLLLEGNDNSYVFKWLQKNELFGLQREQEFSLQQQLASNGLAPQVIAYDANSWVLQEYIAGHPLNDNAVELRTTITDLANALAAVHLQRPDWQGPTLQQRLTHYAKQLPTAAQQQLKQFTAILHTAPEHQVLCHHDLSVSHVLLTANGIKIIDWEYAAWGDRLTDIASTITINRLSAQQADWLVDDYQRLTKMAIDRSALQQHQHLVQWMYTSWYQLLNKDTVG